MNLKPCPVRFSGAHCARVRAFAVAIVCLATTVFVACTGARAQSDTIGLGYEDLYLQAGSGTAQGPVTGAVNMNTLLGADRFYNAGFTGTNAVMANIEAGYIWNGHETLNQVTYIPTTGASGEYDRHATWVGMVMGGRPAGVNPGSYQMGMAPNAQLASGAIATNWPINDSNYQRFTTAFYLDFNGISTFGPYRAAFITGVPTNAGSRPADVVNSSWVGGSGASELSGSDNLSGTLDALICENPRTLFTTAAGNAAGRVPSPASAYNNMTVAALGPDGVAYDLPSFFTNSGPNDYYDPVHGTVTGVRQVVDIAAPGENFATAYYGGETGGNGTGVYGPADGPAGGPDYYTLNIAGTSFAAPTVAGGAALLYDSAYSVFPANANARDSRVMKAVLMNSAAKTKGWDNGQVANPNGLGGVLTTQGLDNFVGAGRMDLNKAFDQFLNGTTDVPGTLTGALGLVNPTGWDYGLSLQDTNNDYLINSTLQAGSKFTATLTWFRNRQTSGLTNFGDVGFDNLDLELWRDIAGIPTDMISTSDSTYNNTEHFSFSIPSTGHYTVRVLFKGVVFSTQVGLASDNYGLAWNTVAVPEPATLIHVILIVGVVSSWRCRNAKSVSKLVSA
jgi:hypothetical protein